LSFREGGGELAVLDLVDDASELGDGVGDLFGFKRDLDEGVPLLNGRIEGGFTTGFEGFFDRLGKFGGNDGGFIKRLTTQGLPDVGVDIELVGEILEVGADIIGVVGLDVVHDGTLVRADDIDDAFDAEAAPARSLLEGEIELDFRFSHLEGDIAEFTPIKENLIFSRLDEVGRKGMTALHFKRFEILSEGRLDLRLDLFFGNVHFHLVWR